MSDFDYSEFTDDTPSGIDLDTLQKVADKQQALQTQLSELEAKADRVRQALRTVAETELPDMMDKIGIESFKTNTGLNIEVSEKIRATISKSNEARAFHWLRDHKHEKLITRVLSLKFSAGEYEEADDCYKALANQFEQVGDKEGVHAQTLSAFVREKLSAGEEIPMDLFGVYRQRVAKVSPAG